MYASYSSLRAAAAALGASGCPKQNLSGANSSGIAWLAGGGRRLVYYSDGDPEDKVFSTHGVAFPRYGTVWPCRDPVLIYYPHPWNLKGGSTAVWMTTLSSSRSQRKRVELGQFRFAGGDPDSFGSGNAIVGADSRIIFFSGTKIRYAGGRDFSVHGLPSGWQINALTVSPTNPSVFLASAGNGARPPCGEGESAIYRVTPTQTVKLAASNQCQVRRQ